MKFLKTIRFDPSDLHVFEQAAPPDEWAVPGSFVFAGAQEDALTGKARQAFSNGFLSLESFGHSTFVSVAELTETQQEKLVDELTMSFINRFGAPNRDLARDAAKEEIAFVVDMCADVAINSIFAVSRQLDESGEIREAFRIVDAPGGKPHARIWEIVEE